MLEEGMILDSRYELIAKIGQGGMSYVYKAMDKKLNRFVALKVLKEEFSTDEEFVEKFRKEAQSVASLVHPNIVAAYDAVDEGELHYIVMELVEGRSLKVRIQKKGTLSNDAAIEIALQTAQGIAAAHKNGIIHRDIKPQNIILARDGSVKVADFGIAKAVTGETISTAVLGSAHYVSPEQAKKGTSDARSDIYSLGITMYEMVTGKLPFDGENTVSVVMAHINKPMIPPEEINADIYPALNDIILKATRKNPNDRYQTAEELIHDLEKCKEDPDGDFVFPEENTNQEVAVSEEGSHKRNSENKNLKNSVISKKVILMFIGAALTGILLAVLILQPAKKEEKDGNEILIENENESEDLSIEVAEEQIIPSVVGMTVEDANKKLNEEKLILVVDSKDYNDIYLEGIITNQTPAEGETTKTGEKVYVTVSLGSKLDSVLKSLKGLTVEEATKRLNEVEVNVLGITPQFSADVEEGLVIGYVTKYNPENKSNYDTEEESVESEEVSGDKVSKGSSIILLVSAGKEEDGTHVPSVTGLDITEAEAVLSGNGLKLGEIHKVPSGNTRDGLIKEQSIQPNNLVKKGTSVDVQVNWDPDIPLNNETYGSIADPDDELSTDFWYGSVDGDYLVGTSFGPSGAQNSVNLGIRLHQRVDDSDEYSVIAEPRPISAGTRLPVSYRNIRGAYGIDKGTVEVYDADTNNVLQTYEIQFYPLAQ